MQIRRKSDFLIHIIILFIFNFWVFAQKEATYSNSLNLPAVISEEILDSTNALKPLKDTTNKTNELIQNKSDSIIKSFSSLTPQDSFYISALNTFPKLGKFHKTMGIYYISAGALAIIAGGTILNKQTVLPFSLALITIGGITIGIGVWEISIGTDLSKIRYKDKL
jgi:hypothetical protein